MRDWATSNPAFATAVAGQSSKPFWSVVLHFPDGDLWIAGRKAVVDAVDHSVIVTELGAIGSSSDRSEPLQLDVATTDVGFVNMPKRTGMPGLLAVGERFTDRWTRDLEAVLADVYLNYETSPGTFVREKMFEAVCSSPSSAGYKGGSLHLASRTERYLNASVLRKISQNLYPFAHQEDKGSFIPIVLGAAPKSPGRVVKGSTGSVPVAGDNSSSAELLPPEVDSSVSETWTITFADATPVESIGSPDSWQDMGLATNTGATTPIVAQSFTIPTAKVLRSIRMRVRANGGTLFGANYEPWYAMRFEIWTDAAGTPGGLLSPLHHFSRAVAPGWPGVTVGLPYQDFLLTNLNLPFGGATTLWLVAWASPGSHRWTWTDGFANKLQWGKFSGGNYGGGTAKKGTFTRVSYASYAAFDAASISGLAWDSALDGQDMYFQLGFGTNEFVLVGSLTGPDGAGTTDQPFVSTSGQVKITTDRWQGHPVAGDTFTFYTDPAPSQIIFSESPPATPVKEIQALYINDQRISNGTTVENFIPASHDNIPWVGGDSRGAMYLGADIQPDLYPDGSLFKVYPWAYEWQGAYVPLDIVGTQSFIRIAFQVFHNDFGPDAAQSLNFVVYRAVKSYGGSAPGGFYWVPDYTQLIARVEVDQSQVPSSPAGPGYPWVEQRIGPFTATDERIFIGMETAQFFPNDFYIFPVMPAPAWNSVLKNHSGAAYVGPLFGAWKFGYRLTGANVTIENSVDDGTGHNVARALVEFDIAEDWKVTADIAGISDNSGGTYSGIPNGVLLTPDSIIHWLLNRAGVDDADIDLAVTFAKARVFYGTIYRFDGIIDADVTYKALILKLAYECRSSFDWIVLATLRVIQTEFTEALTAFTLADILPDSDKVPTLMLQRSADAEVVNAMTANFNRVLAASGNYDAAISRNVPDSVAKYGPLERTDLANLDFVRSKPMAQGVVDTVLARQAYRFKRLQYTTLVPFLATEKDDGATLDLTNAAEGNEAFDGWDGTQILQVETVMVHPELPGIDFVLRESNIEVVIVDGDGYTQPLSVVALLDQGDHTTTYDYIMGIPPHGRWSDPATSGGPVYDAIVVPGGWIYIENRIRKVTTTAPGGSIFTWVGPPPAYIAADEDGDQILYIQY